jgi:hypothetical protein
MSPRLRYATTLVLVLAGGPIGCADDEPRAEPATRAVPDTGAAAPEPGRRYQRRVAFLASGADSTLAVAWMVDAASASTGVRRSARALLLRGGEWEPFLDEQWSTPATRVPWRVLPRGPMRLVVGEDEALERLIYSAAPRELELVLEQPLVDWTGRRGESLRLLEGGLVLGGARVSGLVLDLSRAGAPGAAPGGDWALLVSGDSLQLVLHASANGTDPEGADGNLFQAWARLDFRELIRPELRMLWADTRAFEPARRAVPVRWTFASPDGATEGHLDVVSSWLAAGEGGGPQLPVDAVFEVVGAVTLEGAVYPVRGLFRHTQE